MKIFRRLLQIGFSITMLAAFSATAFAADPPGRVARLEYMTGSVSIQPHGTEDWVEGAVNRPLTNTDNVWADKDSRAELNLGTGFMRLGSETSLTLTNVDNNAVQVELHQGTLNVHIRHLYDGEIYEIDTPNQAFTITKSGDYRFDVDPTGDSTAVIVRKGEGEATGQGSAVKVHSGEQVRFTGGNSLTHESHDAPSPDGFDEWCKVRDKREDSSVSARYVAPGVVGAGDLDDNGTWRDTPEYGHVWVPTSVAPGWAPYRYGHWAWVEPWGWTWVDDAPWGFAPFHYGRWVAFDGYWGWAPGPYYVRPYYAPALVAWFGGPRFGVGFGFGFGGGFGWCPLGFGEPFFPWFGVSRGFFRNVNISNTRITNITNITNNYFNNRNVGGFYGRNGVGIPRYASRPGAFTAVSANTLQHSLPVAPNAARISPSALHNIASISKPDLSPTRANVLGPKAGLPAAHPSAGSAMRPTVSRMTPPANSVRPSAMEPAARNTGIASAHNTVAPSPARGSEGVASAHPLPLPGGRFVPRPPASLGSSNTATRSEPTLMASNHNVPRPMQNPGRISTEPSRMTGGTPATSSPMSRNVPRPPQGSFNRPVMTAHNSMPSTSSTSRSFGNSSPARNMPSNVPRPSGRIMPAPRDYSSAQSRGTYSARSYGGRSETYSGSRGYYGSPYGGGSHGSGGMSSGRSYSAPSRSSGGSYGGRSYSAPSHSSGGSYHGSSGGSGSRGGHR